MERGSVKKEPEANLAVIGEALATPREDRSGLIADAEAFGIELEEVEEDVVEIHPENQRAWDLYLNCQSQMRYGPSGMPTGLDYTGVDVVVRMMGFEKEDFKRMQKIERAFILKTIAEQSRQANGKR